MGIIVKVYIENNDQEIDIVTLNSEDKKSSSVTITASVIKDYLNKLGRNEDLSVRRSDRIASKKSTLGSNETNSEDERPADSLENDNCNSNAIKSENICHSGIHETFTPANGFGERVENTNDHISQHSSVMQLNDVRDYIRVIDECGNSVERDHLTDCDTHSKVVNDEVLPSGHILEDTDTSMCVDPSENAEDADSSTLGTVNVPPQITVDRNDGTVCDNRINDGENTLNIESSSNYERADEPETGAENVIASLKHVSYEVDDFLNMVNTTPNNQSKNNLQLYGFSPFLDEFNCSPSIYADETEEDGELEEYFVVEKIAASRFNEETKVLEFLLKAQKCAARKDPWAPIRTNITDLTISDPKCLYIQCPKSCKSCRRRLHEQFDQYVQFVDLERGFMFDIPTETMSNCAAVVDNTNNEFLPDVTADVVVDPQKSLNDACLIETRLDDNKNITPVKLPKNGENVNNITDIGLPSAHFYIADIVPGLGDQLVEFVENNSAPSTNATNETKIVEKPSKTSDRPRKKHRNDDKHLQCPQCSYKTVNASTLANHLRRHAKEFLKCGLCPKRCLSRGGLKNHEKAHHNGELPLAENTSSEAGHSLAKTIQSRFVDRVKNEMQIQSPFDRKPCAKHFQSVIEAATGNCILFNDCQVKCKMKTKNPSKIRGRPRKLKIETKAADSLEIIDLCDDSTDRVAQDIQTNAAPSSEILQKPLADSIHAIESNDLGDSVAETSNFPNCVLDRKERTCDVCHQPFATTADMFDHKEKLHKYPIVLLKRLSTSL